MILREFAAEPAPLPDEHYVLVCAGLQCQPFAPGGSRLAEDVPRAVDVTDTIPAIAERHRSTSKSMKTCFFAGK